MGALFFFKKTCKKPKARFILIGILTIMALGYSLQHIDLKNHRYMPKPMGYYRIDLPEQHYKPLDGQWPYRFAYSTHAQVLESQSRYKNNYWLNLYYPMFDATIYISYENISNDPKLLSTKLCQEAHTLALKHQFKASLIEEHLMQTPNGYQVTILELWGQVPTPFQFYTTDNKNHFLRGALYLTTALQNDFYAPIIEYIKKDIIHMLNTLEWIDNNTKS